MSPFDRSFGPFDGQVWLNTAHQGALPRVAVAEVEEAIAWKRLPSLMTQERFLAVPARLRRALGMLLSVPPEEIILANSSSYGLHLLANGIPWKTGDEILVVRGDFPSTILPWLGLARRGVGIRLIDPEASVLTPDTLQRQLRPATRLVCTTWVHSFTGYAVDPHALGAVCRQAGVLLVLNASQAVGARAIDLGRTPVDAVTSVGFKWLCGPYGTGFCWIRPALREQLQYNQSYWLSTQTARDLESGGDPTLREDLGAAKYDVFGTANFFNFVPWAAAIELLSRSGMDRIVAHDQKLVDRIITGIDPARYTLLSPRGGSERSTLVFLTHRRPRRNEVIRDRLMRAGVHVAIRRERLRVSPHLYNTEDDIGRALEVLHE